jgi:hypothetical protein
MFKLYFKKIIIIFTLLFISSIATWSAEEIVHKKHKHGHGHGEHDEINMPGLQGIDTTEAEVNDLKTIFKNHKEIKRTVTNLDNGIKTETYSDNEEIRAAIINHVTLMVTRIQENRNPKVLIQSPTLDKLFNNYDKIETSIELTDTGIAVIQTSEDPKVVNLLQTHASEINDMVEKGMRAIHERMMSSKKTN